MARRRMIDPEFFLDEDLAKLTPHARLLYIGLWGIADDNVFTVPARPEWIKAQIFPYENIDISKLLDELVSLDKLLMFQYDGENYKKGDYYFLKNMHKHQKVQHPSVQKYPSLQESSRGLQEGYSSTTVVLQESSLLSKVKLSKEKSNVHFPFNELWNKYPNKVGRKAAERHFNISVQTQADWENIQKAVNNYLKSERVSKGYIQNGSTFFNNWRDWITYTEPVCPQCKGRGRYTSERGYDVNCNCPIGLRRKDKPAKEEQF